MRPHRPTRSVDFQQGALACIAKDAAPKGIAFRQPDRSLLKAATAQRKSDAVTIRTGMLVGEVSITCASKQKIVLPMTLA